MVSVGSSVRLCPYQNGGYEFKSHRSQYPYFQVVECKTTQALWLKAKLKLDFKKMKSTYIYNSVTSVSPTATPSKIAIHCLIESKFWREVQTARRVEITVGFTRMRKNDEVEFLSRYFRKQISLLNFFCLVCEIERNVCKSRQKC